VIVTRRRRKPFPLRRLMLPLIVIAAIVLLLLWPPSRNAVANGPLAPLWRSSATAMAPIAAPFHFAAQNEAMTGLKQQIVQLRKQLATANARAQSTSKAVASLKSVIAQLRSQAVSTNAKTNVPPVSTQSASSGLTTSPSIGAAVQNSSATGDLAAGATADMRRTAADWANMQPTNAAKLVQKLPVAYDARVMALMSPDATGAILDALPASFAAQLTQENPELRH